MGEGFRLRLAEGEELCKRKVQGQRAGLRRSDSGRQATGEVKSEYFGETHDMAADGRVLAWARRTATRSSFTGETGCRYTAWCHARIMQASGLHSRGTTVRVETVDHDDIQVGSWPAAASADQVRGIQRRSGSQPGERMGGQQRHGCGGRRRYSEVKRTNASGDTCTGTWLVV